MHPIRLVVLAGLSLLSAMPFARSADASLPNETPEQYERRIKWFRDAKVGVFVHWNPSVIIEREISWCRNDVGREKYDALYKRFDPKRFNADEWIRTFRDAGIRYAVFVPKHHDGFAMFRTKTYDYNVLNTPFGRDYTKELAEACRKGGVRFCLYYSVLDWWNPAYSPKAGADLTDYVEKTFKPQMQELLTQYGPVGCIWFDGNWDASWNRKNALEVAKLIRQLQPDVMIGNRLEPKARRPGPEVSNTGEPGVAINGDLPYVSSFYDAPDAVGDYQAREMMFGHYYAEKAWDSCYNFAPTPAAPNGAWSWLAGAKPRPLQEIVHWIIQCVGRDGNALLGIGPSPTARSTPPARSGSRSSVPGSGPTARPSMRPAAAPGCPVTGASRPARVTRSTSSSSAGAPSPSAFLRSPSASSRPACSAAPPSRSSPRAPTSSSASPPRSASPSPPSSS